MKDLIIEELRRINTLMNQNINEKTLEKKLRLIFEDEEEELAEVTELLTLPFNYGFLDEIIESILNTRAKWDDQDFVTVSMINPYSKTGELIKIENIKSGNLDDLLEGFQAIRNQNASSIQSFATKLLNNSSLREDFLSFFKDSYLAREAYRMNMLNWLSKNSIPEFDFIANISESMDNFISNPANAANKNITVSQYLDQWFLDNVGVNPTTNPGAYAAYKMRFDMTKKILVENVVGYRKKGKWYLDLGLDETYPNVVRKTGQEADIKIGKVEIPLSQAFSYAGYTFKWLSKTMAGKFLREQKLFLNQRRWLKRKAEFFDDMRTMQQKLLIAEKELREMIRQKPEDVGSSGHINDLFNMLSASYRKHTDVTLNEIKENFNFFVRDLFLKSDTELAQLGYNKNAVNEIWMTINPESGWGGGRYWDAYLTGIANGQSAAYASLWTRELQGMASGLLGLNIIVKKATRYAANRRRYFKVGEVDAKGKPVQITPLEGKPIYQQIDYTDNFLGKVNSELYTSSWGEFTVGDWFRYIYSWMPIDPMYYVRMGLKGRSIDSATASLLVAARGKQGQYFVIIASWLLIEAIALPALLAGVEAFKSHQYQNEINDFMTAIRNICDGDIYKNTLLNEKSEYYDKSLVEFCKNKNGILQNKINKDITQMFAANLPWNGTDYSIMKSYICNTKTGEHIGVVNSTSPEEALKVAPPGTAFCEGAEVGGANLYLTDYSLLNNTPNFGHFIAEKFDTYFANCIVFPLTQSEATESYAKKIANCYAEKMMDGAVISAWKQQLEKFVKTDLKFNGFDIEKTSEQNLKTFMEEYGVNEEMVKRINQINQQIAVLKTTWETGIEIKTEDNGNTYSLIAGTTGEVACKSLFSSFKLLTKESEHPRYEFVKLDSSVCYNKCTDTTKSYCCTMGGYYYSAKEKKWKCLSGESINPPFNY